MLTKTANHHYHGRNTWRKFQCIVSNSVTLSKGLLWISIFFKLLCNVEGHQKKTKCARGTTGSCPKQAYLNYTESKLKTYHVCLHNLQNQFLALRNSIFKETADSTTKPSRKLPFSVEWGASNNPLPSNKLSPFIHSYSTVLHDLLLLLQIPIRNSLKI